MQLAHLLLHDDEIDEAAAGAAVGLRDQQADPTELGHPRPEVVGETALVVDHRTHVGRWRLGAEKGAHGLTQRVLIAAEIEVHGPNLHP